MAAVAADERVERSALTVDLEVLERQVAARRAADRIGALQRFPCERVCADAICRVSVA
jgi:hypothetical protein